MSFTAIPGDGDSTVSVFDCDCGALATLVSTLRL